MRKLRIVEKQYSDGTSKFEIQTRGWFNRWKPIKEHYSAAGYCLLLVKEYNSLEEAQKNLLCVTNNTRKLRIVEKQYNSGAIEYEIQKKLLGFLWWGLGEYDDLNTAKAGLDYYDEGWPRKKIVFQNYEDAQ